MIKVAAYCRVSTDSYDQANSFESQKRYFKEYADRNPHWTLIGIYADKGITGTSIKKRAQFQKMIQDAENGEFSLILTKEVSRFARNTLDTILYSRQLKEKNVGIYFILDNINTLESEGELRLTLMASLAQEESRRTSQRVKWGQKRQMEKGVVFGRSMLGYDVRNGCLFINSEGAETVRLIFHKYAIEGKSTYTIAKELQRDGFKNHSQNTNWTNTTVLKIIQNEKYCGDLVQKKTYTPNYLTHQKKYNRGNEEYVVIKDHHEPIVDKSLWELAQSIHLERSPKDSDKSKYSSRYALSGKIVCGHCRKHFVSRTKRRVDASVYRAWKCSSALKGTADLTACPMKFQISDNEMLFAVTSCIKELVFDKDGIAKELYGIIKAVIYDNAPQRCDKREIQNKQKAIEEKISRLADLYAEGELTKEQYKSKKCSYQNQLTELSSSDNITNYRQSSELLEAIYKKIRHTVTGEQISQSFCKCILQKIVVNSKQNVDVFLLP